MSRKQTLLRSQRNQAFRILQEEGLEPAEFSWGKETVAGVLVVSRLDYRGGTFYFQFSSHDVNSWCAACPGRFRQVEHEYPKNWDEQVGAFRVWVANLKREIKSPDAWTELAKYKLALGVEIAEDVVNEPISAVEAEQIAAALGQLADRIIEEFQPDETRSATIRERLDYLADAARRQRSRDWMYALIGVCVTTTVTLALPHEGATVLWTLFEEGLGPFSRLLPTRTVRPAEPGRRILGIKTRRQGAPGEGIEEPTP